MASEALNEPAEIPRELDRWNWGAFLLNWIWGIGNSTFIALLMFVPFVNIVMIFILGAKGSKWAWRNRYWRDAEHFRRTQRKWAIAGFILLALSLSAAVAMVFTVAGAMKSSAAYTMTMDAVQASDAVKEQLGVPVKAGFWINGQISLVAGGTGVANLSIPLNGSKAAGRVDSHAARDNGTWRLKLVVVTIDGSDVPIVLVNEDKVVVPNAAVGI
ncbi:MAG: cytochrome c oxidase assembly factor Coa1 family protein [Oricola sp.]